MSSVRIQVINPNTSLAMTETIGAAARAVAAPGTEILAVCPRAGVPSIEGHFDEAIAAVGVLEQIRAGREQGVDGHVIACFGDPGLLAARELARAGDRYRGGGNAYGDDGRHPFLHCDHAAAHADHRPSFAAPVRISSTLRGAARH